MSIDTQEQALAEARKPMGMTLIDIMRDAMSELWHGFGHLYDALSVEDQQEIDRYCGFMDAKPFAGLQEVPSNGIDM